MPKIREKFFLYKNKIKKYITFPFLFLFKLKTRSKNDLDLNRQEKLDFQLINSLSRSKIPSLKQLKYVGKTLTKKELLIIRILLVVIIINASFLIYNFYYKNLQIVPKNGGEYIEGVVGMPQYVNPLYSSINNVDSDLEKLIFSSLFKLDNNGQLVNDLASGYTTDNEKVYTITIKDNVKWDNGDKLTAEDIAFTFNAIKNINYNSSIGYKFNDVDIKVIDQNKVRFTLKEKKYYFLNSLTFGILPQKLWSQISPETAKLAELNLKPVGSGKYKFNKLVKDKYGNILLYELVKNNNYYGKKPYIENLTFKFFVNNTEAVSALNNNKISAVGGMVYDSGGIVAVNSLNIRRLELPQVGSIFFNQKSNEKLKNKKIRTALAIALNKYDIVDNSFGKNAQVIHGPLAPYDKAYSKCISSSGDCITKYEFDPWESAKIFNEIGWKKINITSEEIKNIQKKQDKINILKEEKLKKENTESNSEQSNKNDDKTEKDIILTKDEKAKLELGVGKWMVKTSTTTEGEVIEDYLVLDFLIVDKPKYVQMAQDIKSEWANIGVKININTVPLSNLQTKIIKDKDFDCLLWTYDLGNSLDLYHFWHKDEALNLSEYNNKEVNTLLEEARGLNSEDRIEKYSKIQQIITDDIPAIFIYSPYYTYIQRKKIKNVNLNYISNSSERFTDISDWYINTRKEWFFPKQ